METNNMSIGAADCLKLHVYSEPNINSEIICKIMHGDEVVIDLNNSTKEFYKIYTAIGTEGFCRRDLITFK